MGCPIDLTVQIIEQGGDYLLALKLNQDSLHQAVVSTFNEDWSSTVLFLK